MFYVVLTTDKANTVTLVLARADGTATSVFCGFYLFKSAGNILPLLLIAFAEALILLCSRQSHFNFIIGPREFSFQDYIFKWF